MANPEYIVNALDLIGADLIAAKDLPVYYFPNEAAKPWGIVQEGGLVGKVAAFIPNKKTGVLWWCFQPAGFARHMYYVRHDPNAFNIDSLRTQGIDL